ncbi:MAG: hypothetical protein AB7N80_07570 [Bdellovibrionales bacterium]
MGFCAYFAYRVLLHQYRCELTPENCRLPAVLSLINAGNQSKDVKMSLGEAMKRFAQGGGTADEECLKFENYYKPLAAKPGQSWEQIYDSNTIRIAAEAQQQRCEANGVSYTPISESKLVASPLSLFPAGTSKAEAYKAIAQLMREHLTKYYKAKNCPETPMPPHSTANAKFKSTQQLQELLQRGRTIFAVLHVKQPNGKSYGPHAVAVTNFRKKCCLGLCVTQYQVIDSLGHYWAEGGAANEWVSEDDLVKAIDGRQPTNMTWIESLNYRGNPN